MTEFIKIANGFYKLSFGKPEKLNPLNIRNVEHCIDAMNHLSDPELHFDPTTLPCTVSSRGCTLRLPLEEEEAIYGFGLQLKSFQQTGKKVTIRNNADPQSASGDSHAPLPFYVSTKGYGVVVNTARYASFYCGSSRLKAKREALEESKEIASSTQELYDAVPKRAGEQESVVIEIPIAQGVDLFLIEGSSMLEVVQKYNLFSGGGCEVPDWGLGVWYRAKGDFNDCQITALAKQFQEQEIPLDVIGLEPGWHSHAYSCSYVWDSKRMADYETMLRELDEMDIKVNLWEHCFVHPTAPFYEEIYDYTGDYEVWGGVVPDFAVREARKIFMDYHIKEVFKAPVTGLKLDECDGSDFTGGWSYPNSTAFPSGLDGECMHNLLGILYQDTVKQALEKAGIQTYGLVRSSHLYASAMPFVLYSDLYGHEDFIRGVVNSGFGGLLWTPELRDAVSPQDMIRRLQSVVLSAQALINCWYMKNPPWFQIDLALNEADIPMENSAYYTKIAKDWLCLRKKLLPTLQRAFKAYQQEGIPPFRALVLDHPADKEVRDIDDQYYIGDNLLVAPLTAKSDTRRVYFPQGEWKCCFTGKLYTQGWYDVTYPLEQAPLFCKVVRECKTHKTARKRKR